MIVTPRFTRALFAVMAASAASTSIIVAQEMGFEEYEPVSTLVVPEHHLTRAKFPFVDAHNHQWGPRLGAETVDETVADMDRLNLAVMVNLSGGSGDRLKAVIKASKERYPTRFAIFANPSFDGIDDPDYPERTAAQFEADVEAGAQGLKIFKNFGMYVNDAAGHRVQVDDPRLDPLWAKAGELGVPVLIHTGDPHQFWLPHDKYNERWLELKQRPRRKREGEPTFERLLTEQTNVFRKHPETTFIAAHFLWLAHDLDRLGQLMDEIPNMMTELGAVIYEPARQPRQARAFFEKYQDRILMGKDSWAPEEYYVYFRVLETADEYFPYYRKRHAFWSMYGLALPDPVLKKVYFGNALRIIPGIDRSLFPHD
ncbi:amidohydrolase family protein [Synoicihabitans lomoniglobus]|uniref:Amidohydrolase family protein n=1 Tax=Synoicihabitans lomoniglobus TaxID=2909285 RepID=A0AAF0I4L2_9BACT|nr:amidohydrolase family protein [Opitutaceae bacterium LMO-M01]WED66898.1 amidohydrolase family protein [Opitutaceae bacterium LMO-M01]